MTKKILFVINTLSRAGAEMALLELLRRMEEQNHTSQEMFCELSVFVLMGQGELAGSLPESVRLCNRQYTDISVLEHSGQAAMYRNIMKSFIRRGTGIRLSGYLVRAFADMIKKRRILPDKLLWRVISDGAQRMEETYDLAVAFLEGGSAYYVADHVRAKKKAAFIHIDYTQAGYTRQLDRACYTAYDAIFPIGEDVRRKFLAVYPECADRTTIFHNMINQDEIRRKAQLPGGFADDFDGIRLLTVGRLQEQKAYPVAIEAMRLLKQTGVRVRWYVIGEGPQRGELERLIAEAGLEEDFILSGAKDNPYPYFAQTDIYVHATRFEGKSIAIQEAQTLGCAIVASDINWEQITDGTDGLLCELDAAAVCSSILKFINNPGLCRQCAKAAADRAVNFADDIHLLEKLL